MNPLDIDPKDLMVVIEIYSVLFGLPTSYASDICLAGDDNNERIVI